MTSPIKTSTSRRIRSVQIAFSIIDLLQECDGATVTTLADELGHSKSTIHSHLQTLDDLEFLVREGNSYRLSLRILLMAEHVRNQVGNYDVICDEVGKLADETGEVVQFAIEEHGMVSYLYKVTRGEAVETASSVGDRQPMYSTGLGKTILAFLPPDRIDKIIDTCEFDRQTPKTITDPDELYADLERIAERGYGIDDEENVEGLRCVAAPVKSDEKILGAISLAGPSSRFTDDRLHGEFADSVQRVANVIELNTRFS